jgi:hypothetical protein
MSTPWRHHLRNADGLDPHGRIWICLLEVLIRLPTGKLERRWERYLRCLQPQPADRFKSVEGRARSSAAEETVTSDLMWLLTTAALLALAVATWYPFDTPRRPHHWPYYRCKIVQG